MHVQYIILYISHLCECALCFLLKIYTYKWDICIGKGNLRCKHLLDSISHQLSAIVPLSAKLRENGLEYALGS